jgi:hypothetical protein
MHTVPQRGDYVPVPVILYAYGFVAEGKTAGSSGATESEKGKK